MEESRPKSSLIHRQGDIMPKKVQAVMPTVKSLIEEMPSLADNNNRLILIGQCLNG